MWRTKRNFIGAALASVVVLGAGLATSLPIGTATASTARSVAKGSVIKFGLIDPDSSSAIPFPPVGPAATAAQWYVNKKLGGIAGHPISFVVCNSDGTPETNVNCANTFVTDGVRAVIDGIDLASSAELPILNAAHIPTIGMWAENGGANESKTSFYFSSASQAFSVGPLEYFAKKGVKRISFESEDDADSLGYYNGNIIPLADRLGMKVSMTYWPVATGANWPVVASSMESTNPQLMGTAGASDGECTSLLQAIRATSYKGPILLGGCFTYITTLGAKAAQDTYSYSAAWIPQMYKNAPPVVQGQLKIYENAMKVTHGSAQTDTQAGAGVFGAIVTVADLLNSAGVKSSFTGSTITKVLRATHNYQSFLGPKITCNGKQWPNTSACTNTLMSTTVTKTGQIEPAEPQGFIQLNPKLLPAP